MRLSAKTYEIQIAANGRVRLSTFSLFRNYRILWLLRTKYGLRAVDKMKVDVFQEKIYPSLGNSRLELSRSWDIYYGYDYLSGNLETDDFLKTFAVSHLRDVKYEIDA